MSELAGRAPGAVGHGHARRVERLEFDQRPFEGRLRLVGSGREELEGHAAAASEDLVNLCHGVSVEGPSRCSTARIRGVPRALLSPETLLLALGQAPHDEDRQDRRRDVDDEREERDLVAAA